MALVFFSGFETGDFGEWDSVVGACTVVEADGWGAPKTGDYAFRCNPDAALAYIEKTSANIYRQTVYLFVPLEGTVQAKILGRYDGSSQYLYAELMADKKIRLRYHPDTLGEGEAIEEGVWNRISIVHDGSDAYLFVNGIQTATGSGTFACGAVSRVGTYISSYSPDLYFDNYAEDTDTSNDDIGDIRVLRASPNAAGQYAEFDTISGYDKCDEVPADGATTIVDDSGVSVIHRETYNLQDWDTIGGGGSDTIKAVSIWVQAYDSGNSAQGITVRDDGTDYETLALFGKAYTWKNKLYDTNAPRASAWTPAIFTAFQAGGYSEGSKDVYMSCVMVMVAYIPVSGQDYPISLSPGLTASATVAYLVAYDRGMSPGLTASVTIARKLTWDRATSPGLTISTAIAKAFGRLIATASGLTASTTIVKQVGYKRATSPGLTVSVTILKSWGRKITTATGLTVSTTIAMSKGFVRAVIAGLTASATVDRKVAYKKATSPDLAVSITMDRKVAYKRATQPALSVAASVVKSFGKKITTSPGLTVSVTIVKSLGKIITTSPGLAVSVTIAKSIGRTIITAPGLTVSVTVLKSWGRTITTSTNLAVSVAITVVHTVGTKLVRAWGIIFG